MIPAKIILQVTSQEGSIDFFSNKNCAHVPDIPQKIAELKAIKSPENLVREINFWVMVLKILAKISFQVSN